MLWLERSTFIFLCALILILPFSKAGVAVFSIASIILFLVSRTWAAVLRRPVLSDILAPLPVTIPVGIYVLVGLLSIFLSCDTGLSLKGFIGKLLETALLFFVVKGTLVTRRRIFRFLACFLASAAVLCLDGLWQFFSGRDIFRHKDMVEGRIGASMNHPNDLGAYLIIVLPLMLLAAFWIWRLWRERKGLQPGMAFSASLACSAVAFVVLAMTYSRSAWAGLLVGVGLWAVIRRSWKILAFFVFVVIFVLTPMAVSKRALPQSDIPLLRQEAAQEGICGRFLDVLSRGLNSSDRVHYWEAAVRIIKDHPLTGTGLNTYARVVREYAPRHPFYAHNSYLQVAAELGLTGLGVVVWMLLAPLVFALRSLKRMSEPLWVGILSAVAAGYFALLAESALDTTFYSVQLSMLIWALMALLVAIPMASDRERSSN